MNFFSSRKFALMLLVGVLALTQSACSRVEESASLPGVTAASASASSRSLPSEDGLTKIAFLVPEAEGIEAGLRAFLAESETAAEYSFETQIFLSKSVDEQGKVLENIDLWSADVLLLWPLGEMSKFEPLINELSSQGTKILYYGEWVGEDMDTTRLTLDWQQVGQWAGEYVVLHFAQELAAKESVTYLDFSADTALDNKIFSAARTSVWEEYEKQQNYEALSCGGWTYSEAAAATATKLFVPLALSGEVDRVTTAEAKWQKWLEQADEETMAELDVIFTGSDELAVKIGKDLLDYQQSHPEFKAESVLLVGFGGKEEAFWFFFEGEGELIPFVTYYNSGYEWDNAADIALAAAFSVSFQGQSFTEGRAYLMNSTEIDKLSYDYFRNRQENKTLAASE